jgi:xanthine dehydrogenase accessory factor
MRELFRRLAEELRAGRSAVLVTVVASSGSTPRGAGARMLITEAGRLCGTIGGGMVEYRSEQIAQEVLRGGGSRSEHFRLHKNDVADLGMICGGDVDVYFHFIPGGDGAALDLLAQIESLFARGEQSWLITEITEGTNGALAVYSRKSGLFGAAVPEEVLSGLESRPKQHTAEGRRFYSEKLLQAGFVYVFGGGHVAQELVPALARVGFRCIVVEDRPEFARPELFEGVERTILLPMDKLDTLLPEITADDLICIMTRGHKDDFEVQRVMLKSPAYYIGCIGSRHKIASINARLLACGYTQADVDRITKPIGLEICSETPAEIAVSIAAQLILARAKHINGDDSHVGAV